MMLQHATRLVLPLLAVLPSCFAAQDEIGGPAPPRDTSSTTIEDAAEPEASLRLAQYPAAPHEDRRGRLWFGTAFEGLIRYDGEAFVTFTTEDGLAGDTVREIHEDEDGTLWFATSGGLSRYDGERFTSLTDYALDTITYGFNEAGNHLDLWDVTRDSQGRLWIATLDGAFRHDGNSFLPFALEALAQPHEFEFTSNMVYSVFEDRDGDLWFSTDGAGVVRYDGERQTVFTEADGLSSDHVAVVAQDASATYWLGTSNGGVSRFDGKEFTTHLRNPVFSKHNGWGRFLGVLVDSRGVVWLGRSSPGGGVYRHDGDDFELLSTEAGLGDGGIIGVTEDRSGRIWAGSTTGVFRFDGERFVELTRQGWRGASEGPR